MITLDRMALADLASPAALVQGLLKQLPDIPIPVPIEEIARALDINDIKPLTTKGFEGGLVTDTTKSEGTILVNQNNSRGRQRFTIGHELGHFLSPWHEPATPDGFLCMSRDFVATDVRARDKVKRMEAEANRFSAGLLMPMLPLRKDLRRLGGPELAHIVTLADTYDVSKEALGRRYVELHDECCALVISKDDRYLYSYRHDDFPFVDLQKDNPLPKGSLSKTSSAPEGIITEWAEVPPYTWISQPRKVTALFEQTMRQHQGYRITLLQTELRDEEEEAEEDDLEESWTPRFRR
jgi:hypothetical protein